MSLFGFLLFLHVLGAIVAFGPSFAFPIIGGMGGKEPLHANFATRVTEVIAKRLIFPLALIQGVTGVALIVTGNTDLTKALWLDVALVLYVVALAFSYFVQTPRVAALVAMTSSPPPPPTADAPVSGPPPAISTAVKNVQQGGTILGLLVIVIVFLMVLKPF